MEFWQIHFKSHHVLTKSGQSGCGFTKSQNCSHLAEAFSCKAYLSYCRHFKKICSRLRASRKGFVFNFVNHANQVGQKPNCICSTLGRRRLLKVCTMYIQYYTRICRYLNSPRSEKRARRKLEIQYFHEGRLFITNFFLLTIAF